MKKIFIVFFIFASMFGYVPKLVAWSDDVTGVLMPEPRGGGGISGEEAEGAMSDESEPADVQALIEWE